MTRLSCPTGVRCPALGRLAAVAHTSVAGEHTRGSSFGGWGPDELWDGMLRSSFRVGRVILKQASATQKRLRIEFARLVKECLVERGVEVPMSVKVASGRKPLRRVRRV